MTWSYSFGGIICTTVLAMGTAASGEEPKAPPAVAPAKQLSEADNGKTFNLKVGDLLTISLKGNFTTGYGWQTAKLDGEAVEQMGEPIYTTDPSPKGMTGVGGMFLFKFNAAKPGKTQISLECVRPWEKNIKPAQTFTTTIEVKAPAIEPPTSGDSGQPPGPDRAAQPCGAYQGYHDHCRTPRRWLFRAAR